MSAITGNLNFAEHIHQPHETAKYQGQVFATAGPCVVAAAADAIGRHLRLGRAALGCKGVKRAARQGDTGREILRSVCTPAFFLRAIGGPVRWG
jgi:hypothetical protein